MKAIVFILTVVSLLEAKIKIKALILPKFEVGELTGDFPGEAQYYYDYYIKKHHFTKFTVVNTPEPLYVNEEGVALIVTLMGKAQSGQTVATVLADNRFDFKDTLVVSTGCAGSTPERTVLGDVILGGVVIDHELGHGNDKEDIPDGAPLFIRDQSYDYGAYTLINETLLEWAYDLTRSIKLNDTERSREVLNQYKEDGLLRRVRKPQVQIGGILTGDNYWAGHSAYERVEQLFEAYNSPYDYMITEMEDSAIGVAVKRAGLQNQYLIIRDSVDFDVPLSTGSILDFWEETSSTGLDFDWGIFEVARKNNFEVGKEIIDSWLMEKKGRIRKCHY